MKALVTGGSGFIGSRLISFLAENGVEVRALLRKTSKVDHLKGISYERVEGDLSDIASLKKAVKDVDVVFHLAAVLAGNTSDDYYRANQTGTENLMNAVIAENPGLKRFVFVSSLAAGGPATSAKPRSESDADAPVSFYGKSKLAAEKALQPYFERVPTVILRPPIVYGLRDRSTLILAKIAKGRVVPMIAPGNPERMKFHSIIHVDDLVQALWLVGSAPAGRIPSGTHYYVSDMRDLSYRDLIGGYGSAIGTRNLYLTLPLFLVKMVARLLTFFGKLTGKTFMLNNDKVNEIVPDYWICSAEKIQRELGFQPRMEFSRGVKETVEWYRKEGWL